MSTSKHPKSREGETPFENDLERNPGIGQSAGLSRREGLAEIEGDNSVEGDVENTAGPGGAIFAWGIRRKEDRKRQLKQTHVQ